MFFITNCTRMSFNPIAPLTLWSVYIRKTQVKSEIVDQSFLANLSSVYCSYIHTYIPQKRWPNSGVDLGCRKVKVSTVCKKVILRSQMFYCGVYRYLFFMCVYNKQQFRCLLHKRSRLRTCKTRCIFLWF